MQGSWGELAGEPLGPHSFTEFQRWTTDSLGCRRSDPRVAKLTRRPSIARRHGMGGFQLIVGIVPVVVIVIFIIATSVRILREYDRAVMFRFVLAARRRLCLASWRRST